MQTYALLAIGGDGEAVLPALRYETFDAAPGRLHPDKGMQWAHVVETRPEPGPGEMLSGPVETVTSEPAEIAVQVEVIRDVRGEDGEPTGETETAMETRTDTVLAYTLTRVWTAVPVPPPSPEEVIAERAAAVQAHMDEAAQAHGYDSIHTACTYADEPAVPRFQLEGQTFRAWRSLCWARCYELLAETEAGKREPLSNEGLIALLPALDWPA